MILLESLVLNDGQITIIPSGTNITVVESRTIGGYDIDASTSEKRIFVPDPRRPGKKIPVSLITQTVTFTHNETGEVVTFGGYKHQGKWLYSFTNRHGKKTTGYSLKEIATMMSRMVPVDIDSVERLLGPHGSEKEIHQIAPTSQEDSMRVIKALMDMVDELQSEIENETDQAELQELESELAGAKNKLKNLGITI